MKLIKIILFYYFILIENFYNIYLIIINVTTIHAMVNKIF